MKVDADNRFAIVPEWILYHPDLSAQAVRLYGVLSRHTDDKTRSGSPGRAKLAARMSCSRDTVDRAVDELVSAGAVDVVNRWRDKAKTIRDSNVYRLKTVAPRGNDAHTRAGETSADALTSDNGAPVAPAMAGAGTGAPTPAPAATGELALRGGGKDAVTPGGKDAARSTESSKTTESSIERTTAASRPRDEVFDALAVYAEDSDPLELTRPKARSIGVAAATIRRVAPDVTPIEIARRAALYPQHFRDATLTANDLAAHWARCAHPPQRGRASAAQETAAEAEAMAAVGL